MPGRVQARFIWILSAFFAALLLAGVLGTRGGDPPARWAPVQRSRELAPAARERAAIVPSGPSTTDRLARLVREIESGAGPGVARGFSALLAHLSDGSLDPALREIVTGDDPVPVREIAIWLTAMSPDPAGHRWLRKFARGASDDTPGGAAAILALGLLPSDETELLERVLLSGGPRSTAAAALSLARRGGRASQETLARALSSTSDPDRRLSIYAALTNPGIGTVVSRPLAVLIGRGPPCGLAMPRGGDAESLGRLVAAVAAETEPALLAPAARTLSGVPGDAAVESVMDLWARCPPARRPAVVSALAGTTSRSLLAAVVTRGRTADRVDVRRSAALVIGRRPELCAAVPLKAWCGSETDAGVREVLRRALDARGDP